MLFKSRFSKDGEEMCEGYSLLELLSSEPSTTNPHFLPRKNTTLEGLRPGIGVIGTPEQEAKLAIGL